MIKNIISTPLNRISRDNISLQLIMCKVTLIRICDVFHLLITALCLLAFDVINFDNETKVKRKQVRLVNHFWFDQVLSELNIKIVVQFLLFLTIVVPQFFQ